MPEEIYKNIYRIHVPLKGNPLKELNAYFIDSEGEQYLIDNGFNTDECYDALTAGLNELGCDYKKLKLINTHLHSDHSGNTNRLCEYDNKVYMSETDMNFVKGFARKRRYNLRDERFLSEGFLLEWLTAQKKSNPAFMAGMTDPEAVNFIPMHTGDKIRAGEYELMWIECPGHTPGNSMLYEARHKIMFTGDNILFTITPNITSWPEMEDALGSYLESLKESKKYDVKFAFPGHREFEDSDYYARIDSLLAHHRRRLNEALSIVRANPGFNAVEVCSRMTWKIRCDSWDDFPVTQRFFAAGETFSHMDYLRLRGFVRREKDPDGIWRYEAITDKNVE